MNGEASSIVAVQARLNAAGYFPEIIAPSCTNMGNALSYFDALAAVPGALTALDEICYHRYGGVSDANLQALALRGQQNGKSTSMLEWWSTGNGIDVLFKDLTMGRNSLAAGHFRGHRPGQRRHGALHGGHERPGAGRAGQPQDPAAAPGLSFRPARSGAGGGHDPNLTFQPHTTDGVVVVRPTVGGLPGCGYSRRVASTTDCSAVQPSPPRKRRGGRRSASIPAAGALTVYPLQPHDRRISADNTVHLAIRSLPGFTGSIERTSIRRSRTVGRSRPLGRRDFLFDWSEATVPLASTASAAVSLSMKGFNDELVNGYLATLALAVALARRPTYAWGGRRAEPMTKAAAKGYGRPGGRVGEGAVILDTDIGTDIDASRWRSCWPARTGSYRGDHGER
jgi:hypothetical protein